MFRVALLFMTLTETIEISGTWVFATGQAYTMPSGAYDFSEWDVQEYSEVSMIFILSEKLVLYRKKWLIECLTIIEWILNLSKKFDSIWYSLEISFKPI